MLVHLVHIVGVESNDKIYASKEWEKIAILLIDTMVASAMALGFSGEFRESLTSTLRCFDKFSLTF